MSSSNPLDLVRTEITALDDQLNPLETQISTLRKAKNAQVKALKKHMEQNNITECVINGIRYSRVEEQNVKCTLERMRNTLPEDTMQDYVQQNTVTEVKFKKEKVA